MWSQAVFSLVGYVHVHTSLARHLLVRKNPAFAEFDDLESEI